MASTQVQGVDQFHFLSLPSFSAVFQKTLSSSFTANCPNAVASAWFVFFGDVSALGTRAVVVQSVFSGPTGRGGACAGRGV